MGLCGQRRSIEVQPYNLHAVDDDVSPFIPVDQDFRFLVSRFPGGLGDGRAVQAVRSAAPSRPSLEDRGQNQQNGDGPEQDRRDDRRLSHGRDYPDGANRRQ
jgi:hypothetical protein